MVRQYISGFLVMLGTAGLLGCGSQSGRQLSGVSGRDRAAEDPAAAIDPTSVFSELEKQRAPYNRFRCRTKGNPGDGSIQISWAVPDHICACGIELYFSMTPDDIQYKMLTGLKTESRGNDIKALSSSPSRLEALFEGIEGCEGDRCWRRVSKSDQRFSEQEDIFTGMFEEVYPGVRQLLLRKCTDDWVFDAAYETERVRMYGERRRPH